MDKLNVAADEEKPFVCLQVLRALVAISIFSSHWTDYFYPDLTRQAQLEIDFFFAIEGFFAARLIERLQAARTEGLGPIWQRLLKIYPLYLIGLIAGLLAIWPFAMSRQNGWSSDLAFQALALGAVLQPTFSDAVNGAVFPLNPPSWAIVLEVWIFILLWLGRRWISTRSLLAGCLLAGAIVFGLYVAWHDLNLGWRTQGYIGGFPRVVFGFLCGMLLYRFLPKFEGLLPSLPPALIWVVYGAILFLRIRFIGAPLLFVGMPLLVCLGAVSKNPEHLKPLARSAARHAYALYLVHFPLLTALVMTGFSLRLPGWFMAGPASYLVCLGALLIVSYLLIRFVDEPLQNLAAPQTADDTELNPEKVEM